MAVSRKAMTEGIRTPTFLSTPIDVALQSLSQKSKIFASSLYTREPGCSRTSAYFNHFHTVPAKIRILYFIFPKIMIK